MLRMFPVSGFQNWLMFYREAADHVLIVRIIHAKRDLPALFGEKGG
jgi:plasmid stabilization system protein ParE